MADQKDKIKIIVLEPVTPLVEELIKAQQSRTDVEWERAHSVDDAAGLALAYLPCMLLASVQENKDIPLVINLLKKVERGIKYGRLKSMITSKIKNKQLANLVTGMGVTDYIEEPSPARTLVFKSNLQIKAVETVQKQEAAKLKAQEKTVFKKDQEKISAEGEPEKTKSKDALTLGEDMFLFKNTGAKKNGKKMVLEAEGPDPAAGDWTQHEDKGDAKNAWRWLPNEEKAKPKEAQSKDGWVHEGDKPTFNPASKKWQLVSEKPDLSFVKNGKKVASKVSTSPTGQVEVAKDSAQAEENINKIALKWNPAAAKKPVVTAQAKPDAAKAADPAFNNNTGGPKDSPEHKKNLDLKPEEKTESKELNFKEKKKPEKPGKELSLKEKEEAEKQSKELNFKDKKKPEKAAKDFVDSGEAAAKSPPGKDSAEISRAIDAKGEGKLFEAKAEKTESSLEKGKQSLDWEADKGDFNGLKNKKKKAGGLEENAEAEESDGEPSLVEQLKQKKKREAESKADAMKRLLGKFDEDEEEEASGDELSFKQKKKPKNEEEDREAKLARLKEKAKDKKKTVMTDLQEELKKPLPETLPPEEAKRLRKELGAEDPAISDKELARKNKFNRLKALKEKLKDVETDLNAIEDLVKDPKVHELKETEAENTRSEKQFDKSRVNERNFNARDSDISEAEQDSEKKKAKTENADKPKREVPASEPEFFKEEGELLPAGAAWECTGKFYVFLDAKTHYKGFKDLKEILPLWIYEGEFKPELLSIIKKWRFYTRPPVLAESSAELPLEVLDYINSLNKDAEKSEKKDDKGDRLAGLKDRFKDKGDKSIDGEAAADTAEPETEDEKKPITYKEKIEQIEKKKEKLKEKMEEGKTVFQEKEQEKKKKAEEADPIADLKERLGKNEEEEREAEAEASAEEKNGAEEVESLDLGKKKGEKQDDKSDRLAALKAKFGEKDKENDEQATGKEKKNNAEADAPAETQLEKVAKKSAALEKFFERRKAREESDKAEAAKPDESTEAPRSPSDPKVAYLGIYVVLSDAAYLNQNFPRTAERLATAISGSFGNSNAFFLAFTGKEKSGLVLGSSSEKYSPKETVSCAGDGFLTFDLKEAKSDNLLGYMCLEKAREFTKEELTALSQIAELIAPIWEAKQGDKKGKAA